MGEDTTQVDKANAELDLYSLLDKFVGALNNVSERLDKVEAASTEAEEDEVKVEKSEEAKNAKEDEAEDTEDKAEDTENSEEDEADDEAEDTEDKTEETEDKAEDMEMKKPKKSKADDEEKKKKNPFGMNKDELGRLDGLLTDMMKKGEEASMDDIQAMARKIAQKEVEKQLKSKMGIVTVGSSIVPTPEETPKIDKAEEQDDETDISDIENVQKEAAGLTFEQLNKIREKMGLLDVSFMPQEFPRLGE